MDDAIQTLISWDRAAVVALNAWLGVNPRFDRILHLINGNALFKGLPFVAILWLYSGRDKTHRFIIRWLMGVFAALIVARLMQNVGPEHMRPVVDPSLELKTFDPTDQNYFYKFNSFPSDHAVEFGAMSLAIASRNIKLGLLAFVWALAVILLPRIYFGYHYPSDVIAGCLLGAAIMAVFLYLPTPRRWARIGERMLAAHPGLAMAAAFVVSSQIVSNFGEIRELLSAFKLRP